MHEMRDKDASQEIGIIGLKLLHVPLVLHRLVDEYCRNMKHQPLPIVRSRSVSTFVADLKSFSL